MNHRYAASLLLGLCGFGCMAEEPAIASYETDPRWPVVSQMLGARCGSLDCHGQAGRPLRLYHRHGLRLDPEGAPGDGNTTAAEHTANLRSALALEPELTASVMTEGGIDAERLTLVRKALGIEEHKGGQVLVRGGDGDRCLRSWLQGLTNEEACATATTLERE